MLKGINVEEIKKYNESLRAHKERAAKLQAEIEFNSAELNRLCEELTKELGVQVTPENLDEIYKDRVERINSTLETGKDILRRIEAEEQALNTMPTNLNEEDVIGTVETSGEVFSNNLENDATAGENPLFNFDDITI